MRLARVELFGFKSFADKTVFDFSNGITAILGPNGCGKSNVVDAIKWVLGEQNARNLRGGEMLDVIFSGSEVRRPMGMAEVSLVFDNSDGTLASEYNEVCVTRRLYRSGESEYLLNRQKCRLRDIRELFMDTGIGTSAYSFIEQGKVEALLSAKPHERRLVFEEAAGISKYKARRKEALARMERTEQYLLRVNDIVEEVEKRIRSVSRQAQNARRFQRLTEELRQTRGRLYVARWQADSEKLDTIREKLTDLAELQAQEGARSGQLGGVIAELQKAQMDIETRMEEARTSHATIQQDVSALESEKARLLERQHSLDREATDADDFAARLRTRISNMATEKENLQQDRESLTGSTSKIEKEVTELSATSDALARQMAELDTRLEGIRTALNDLTTERQEASTAHTRLESDARSIEARCQTVSNRREELANRRDPLATETTALAEKSNVLATEEATLRTAIQEDREKLESTRTNAETIGQELSQSEKTLSGCQSRLQTLQELEASMAGLFKGVKAILEAKQAGESSASDIEGLVADLFTAKPEVALAIETALGSSQQNVITRTATGAREAIQYLKRERAGRATFLPLDRIQPHSRLEGHVRSAAGVVGEAIDLVDFDEKYRAAAEYLLAGILVVENLDQALALRDNSARGVRMVTLEGDIINPAGAMTGGRDSHQKGGLVTRKSEIDALVGEINALEHKGSELRANRDSLLAGIASLNLSLRDAETRYQQLEQEYRNTQNALASKQAELSGMDEEAKNLATETEEASARLASISAEREHLQQTLAELTAREDELRRELTLEQPKLHELRTEANDRGAELTQRKVEYAGQMQRLADVNSRLESMDRDAADQTEQVEIAVRRATDARRLRGELDSEICSLEERLTGKLRQRDSGDEFMAGLRNELGNNRAELESRREEERAIGKRTAEISQSINNLKMDERECLIHIESIQEKAREELEVEDMADFANRVAAGTAFDEDVEDEDYTDEDDEEYSATETAEELLDPKALDAHVRELQEKIQRIGPVNHAAIEELAELKARREFLTSQQEDLASARNDVDQLLQRLNNECRRRFDDTFNSVRENFQILFKRLFGGGRADLILEECEDPLNAGIEIIARPPGKEPTSISLLSGGEKALCAVALLFSIFRSKPSPFCILDEVDGPLDESNIDRYMTVLREFAEQSQFIIITHSKRTMSMVDRIYGVTQSEPGISRHYSLRFSAAEGDLVTTDAEDTAAAGVA